MKFVNLIAGPGSGKSTGAQLLAGMLSASGYRTELVQEFAKAMTWQKNTAALKNQLYMFAKQDHRLEVLRDEPLDFVIIDGCILNALIFPLAREYPSFEPLVIEVFNSYENINFFIERVVPFSTVGRNENEEEARQKCLELENVMTRHGIPSYKKLPGDIYAPGEIYTILTGKQPPLVPVV
jgi:ABC-type oligopeptide transport system ATPase subunit